MNTPIGSHSRVPRVSDLVEDPQEQMMPYVLKPGFYVKDDTIYRVKRSKRTGRVHALKLTLIGGKRLNKNDEVVRFDFEYAPGAIFRLRPEDRLSIEQVDELSIRHKYCLICGAFLKDASSVERGIGPVCRKRLKEEYDEEIRP